MLRLQDELNKKVNSEWLTAVEDWPRAIHAESIELMNHIGWKWWKRQEPDQAQIELELVDIWHFIMSLAIIGCDGSLQRAALLMNDIWNQEPPVEITDAPAVELAEGLGVLFYMGATPKGFLVFRGLLDACHLPDERLYIRYVAKNVLNIFRQDHGYQDGTYVKVWNGQEDNEVLARIMAKHPDASPNDLLVALTAAYKTVV